MLNIFLVLAAYYLIKPVQEGWLSISDIRGLSKIELKAYSSFAQTLVLLLVVPYRCSSTRSESVRNGFGQVPLIH